MDDRTPRRHPSRREMIALGVGSFVVAAVPFARARRTPLVRRTIPVMGTIAEVGVVHPDARRAQGAIDAAFEQLRWVETRMSRFLPTSDVGRANATAARDGVAVSNATADVLEAALQWAQATDGAFDPCLGQVIALWDFPHRTAPPPASQLQRFAGLHLYRTLDLDRSPGGALIRFEHPAAAIDLGGIGKGYGVDRAVHALREWGIDRGLVNVGGDLYALGTSEDGDPWEVGIRSPEDPRRLAGRLSVRDGAVATSGDYLQQFEYGGRHYHHLLDPASGTPRRATVHSVTVRASSCMHADAAATAVFGMDDAPARAVLQHVGDAEIVKSV
jgi:thiamine biosynthesis lipoprotein